MGSEDFAYMLEARWCLYQSWHWRYRRAYDFNDEALPIGASLFARLVEKKLPRISGN
jgi:hippurate hydrolase